MRVARFLTTITFITCFSLLYVYQQTEVFRLAYLAQKKQSNFQDLLDKNSVLRYNIKRNASLVQLGNRISHSVDFQMPDSYRLVRLAPSAQDLKLKGESANKETILSRLFGIKRQAEARTISP